MQQDTPSSGPDQAAPSPSSSHPHALLRPPHPTAAPGVSFSPGRLAQLRMGLTRVVTVGPNGEVISQGPAPAPQAAGPPPPYIPPPPPYPGAPMGVAPPNVMQQQKRPLLLQVMLWLQCF